MSEVNPVEHVNPERILMLFNPNASRAKHAAREVYATGLPVTEIETAREAEVIRDRLLNHDPEGAIIMAVGGDGTASAVGNVLLRREVQDAGFAEVPYLPRPAGNANDIARMVNGRKSAREILATGQLIPVAPIEVSMYSDLGHTLHHAFGYFGIGNTAEAAGKLDELKKTSSPLKRAIGWQMAREIKTSFSTVAQTETFMVKIDRQEAVALTDLVAARGDRMAKIGHPKADLNEPLFQLADIRSRGYFSTAVTMGRLGLGLLNKPLVNYASITISEAGGNLAAQIDGEQLDIPHGAHIDLEISPDSVMMLSTRLGLVTEFFDTDFDSRITND